MNFDNCWKIVLALFIILGITFLTLSPVIYNDFTNWDDPAYVLDNKIIKEEISLQNLNGIFSSYVSGNYHPLTILSFAVEYHFFQLNPAVYHLTNLILHLFNILLVYWLIFLLTGRNITSLITALLFGIHPLHVEAVAWISSRKDVLFSFFYLGALITYILYITKPQFKLRFFMLTLILFISSLLSKPHAASLPFLFLVFDYYLKRKWRRKIIFEKIPFFLLSLIFGLIAFFGQKQLGSIPETSPYTFLNQSLFVFHGFLTYLVKFIAPFKLSCFYPYPDKINNFLPFLVYLSPFFIILLVVAVFKTVRYTKEILFGFLFYLTIIVFILKFIPVGGFIIADRYTYLPYIGLSFIIGQGCSSLVYRKTKLTASRKLLTILLLLGYIGILSFLSWNRSHVWKDSISLWTDVISKYSTISLSYHNRGRAYSDRGYYTQAMNDFNKALQLDPDYPEAISDRGIVYSHQNRSQLAIGEFNRALAIKPDFMQPYNNLGVEYSKLGKYNAALKDFNKALELDPASPEIYLNRAKVYEKQGKYDLAITDLTTALDRNPDLPEAYSRRGVIYVRKHSYTQAITDFSKASALKPEIPGVYNNRGIAYSLKGEYSLAIADFTKSLSINPDDLNAYCNRGALYRKMGNYSHAIVDYTKTVNINPNFVEGYLKRAELYILKNEIEKASTDYDRIINIHNANKSPVTKTQKNRQ